MSIGERIKKVRNFYGYTQQSMADTLNLKRQTIAAYEAGAVAPSDRTIIDICQKFNVNEKWLRTGEGEPYCKKTQKDLISEFMGDLLSSEPGFRQQLVLLLARMTKDEWKILEKKALELVEALKETSEVPHTIREEPPTIIRYPVPQYQDPMSAGHGENIGTAYAENINLVKEPPRGTSFIARISGDSMEPDYHDGEWVFVHAQNEIRIGQVGVFWMDGNEFIKELGEGELISHNLAYDNIAMNRDMICQGLVLGICDDSYFEK